MSHREQQICDTVREKLSRELIRRVLAESALTVKHSQRKWTEDVNGL
jgi:hypothetical protein